MPAIPTAPHAFATLASACAVLNLATLASVTAEADQRHTVGKGNKAPHGLFRFATRRNAMASILALCDDATLALVEAGKPSHVCAVATALPGLWSKGDDAIRNGTPDAIPGIMRNVAESTLDALKGYATALRWDWESVPCIPALAGLERSKRAEAKAKAEAEAAKAKAEADKAEADKAKAEAAPAPVAEAAPAPAPIKAKRERKAKAK